jgi:hypothetical protein
VGLVINSHSSRISLSTSGTWASPTQSCSLGTTRTKPMQESLLDRPQFTYPLQNKLKTTADGLEPQQVAVPTSTHNNRPKHYVQQSTVCTKCTTPRPTSFESTVQCTLHTQHFSCHQPSAAAALSAASVGPTPPVKSAHPAKAADLGSPTSAVQGSNSSSSRQRVSSVSCLGRQLYDRAN